MYDDVWGYRQYAKGFTLQHEKVEDRTNVWRKEVKKSENKKRHISGRWFLNITFRVSSDIQVVGVDRSKGRISVGISARK